MQVRQYDILGNAANAGYRLHTVRVKLLAPLIGQINTAGTITNTTL